MIVSWRNVWNLLRIEPSTADTTVDGNAQGVVASGTFQGGSGGNTTINILNPPPPPPEPPPETATLGDRIRYITLAMMNLQQMFTEDRNDRLARQAESDRQHTEAQRGRAWIWRAMFLLAIVVMGIGALMLYMFWRLDWLF